MPKPKKKNRFIVYLKNLKGRLGKHIKTHPSLWAWFGVHVLVILTIANALMYFTRPLIAIKMNAEAYYKSLYRVELTEKDMEIAKLLSLINVLIIERNDAKYEAGYWKAKCMEMENDISEIFETKSNNTLTRTEDGNFIIDADKMDEILKLDSDIDPPDGGD